MDSCLNTVYVDDMCQRSCVAEWVGSLLAAPAARVRFPVGLSEINFSDLYCGWLGRIINVEYNTIQYNTTQYNLSLIHISEPTRLLSISYAVFCLKKKKTTQYKICENDH